MNSLAPKFPLLRYYGGKWRIAPWIISHMPEHRTYVEPFAGAASVFMRKPPCEIEVLNDIYSRIYNLFNVLRDDKKRARLIRQLKYTPYCRKEFLASAEESNKSVEDARRMIVASWQGVGATSVSGGKKDGWRRGGKPGRYNTANNYIRVTKGLESFASRLQGAFIDSVTAEVVIKKWDSPETLFYVDPPYVISTRHSTLANKGYRHEMDNNDHLKLALVLNEVRGKVVLSGYDNPLYNDFYKDWRKVSKSASTSGVNKVETIWIKD